MRQRQQLVSAGILILIKVWRRGVGDCSGQAPGVRSPRNKGRQAAARAPSRGGAFFEAVRRGRSRSPLLAGRRRGRPPQSCNPGTGTTSRVERYWTREGALPPDTSPQGHPRNDKQEWLVSAPGLHHPRAQAGGPCPRPPPSRLCLQPRSRRLWRTRPCRKTATIHEEAWP